MHPLRFSGVRTDKYSFILKFVTMIEACEIEEWLS